VPSHTFKLNGQQVTVDVPDDLRLLWVLRDVLGVMGPKYGCGLDVCKACTSHINGKAFNPCSVRVSDIKPTDEVTTIEGLPATVGKPLHPMQQAWLDFDVAQCGYCQPGQIMAAVAKVKQARAAGHEITDAELDYARRGAGRSAATTRRRHDVALAHFGETAACSRSRRSADSRGSLAVSTPSVGNSVWWMSV
jgi:isoquinoline 1-oxidoreductase alpha subunit